MKLEKYKLNNAKGELDLVFPSIEHKQQVEPILVLSHDINTLFNPNSLALISANLIISVTYPFFQMNM